MAKDIPGGPVVENLPVDAGDNGFYWKIPYAFGHGQLSFRATTTEALAPHSLCSATREASATRRLHTTPRKQPPFTATTHSNQDPAQPKVNKQTTNAVAETRGPLVWLGSCGPRVWNERRRCLAGPGTRAPAVFWKSGHSYEPWSQKLVQIPALKLLDL